MLMDLTCPVEFRQVEVLRDSSGRAQAYLTFFNLADETVSSLDAMVTMLGEDGISRGIRPLKYEQLDARPHAAFTICLGMEGLPFFVDARVVIHRVGFVFAPDWNWDKDALMDCTPKLLAPGPQRVALVAVAGKDAVCFPERRKEVWICVCGRFNKRAWRTCRRCQRAREETFGRYTLEQVMQEYLLRTKRREAQDMEERRAQGEQARQQAQRRFRDFNRQVGLIKMHRRRRVIAAVLVLCAGIALFLALRNIGPKQGEETAPQVPRSYGSIHIFEQGAVAHATAPQNLDIV